MTTIKYIALILLLLAPASIYADQSNTENIYGDLNLESIYEGEPKAGERFFQELTYDNSVGSLRDIRKALEKPKSIGFEARIGLDMKHYIVLFTLMKQNYVISKLDYDIAKYKLKQNEINESILNQRKEKYIKAKQDFENYYNAIKFGE
ncbi:MAG: hypothetical protein ABFS18_14500 [Thermodesulfobacteriota bacterium]